MNNKKIDSSLTSPLVSVVIPVKNGENFLKEAIDSVLLQTLDNFELLICINPSTDKTLEVASEYLSDPRVRVIPFKEPVGISANFDRASGLATGKYIKFLCHDDILLPNCLELMVQQIEMLGVSMVCSYEKFLNSANAPRTGSAFGNRTVVSTKRSLQRFVRYGNWVGSPTGVLMKNIDHVYFQESLNCAWDQELWTRISLTSAIGVVPEILYLTRIHSEQQTSYCHQGGFEIERRWILSEMSRVRGDYPLWINLVATFFKLKEFGLYR
jgi:glycosyltransferase involved in cell wall biosynthesis